ncbi:hypothetical protein ACFYZ8_34570 [Streptomyces sp. NPDC001668]|uniref:hypothetical protein n=1 Tax=Streptomyces sp. NPDC001668 TaxID=3364598 RepID=UPI0036C629D7
MARGEPSGADQELIERLAALGLAVSAAQLERWRGAGLLPAHARAWLGRGRGSVSVLGEDTVAVAAVLARHARPGRDLRWTVIAWYAEAGQPALPGQLAVPEPPWPAVHEALVWAMSRSAAQRLVKAARAAAGGGDEAEEAFYAQAGRVVGRGPGGPPDAEEMRRVLEDPGAELERGEDRRRRRGAVSLAAAAGMGAGEVGGTVLVDALAALMPHLDWGPVAAAARQAEEEGTLQGWIPAGSVDPLARLSAAGEQEMAAARRTAQLLAGIGGLYLMHGLGMPDNPALTRLRAHIEASGFALVMAQMVPMMINPSGIPHVLAMCLALEMAALAAWFETLLADQAATGRGLLRLPGDEQGGAEAYMRAWIDHIHQLGARARSGADAHQEETVADGAGDGGAAGGRSGAAGAAAAPQGAGRMPEQDQQPDAEGIADDRR